MYKFTNGIVVYDEKTRDEYIKAGMILATNKEMANVEEDRPNRLEKSGESEDGTESVDRQTMGKRVNRKSSK